MDGVIEAQTNHQEQIIAGNIKRNIYGIQRANLKMSIDSITRKYIEYGVLDSTEIAPMQSAIFSTIDKKFKEAMEAFEKGLLSAENARVNISDKDKYKSLLLEAQNHFAAGSYSLKSLAVQLSEDFAIAGSGWEKLPSAAKEAQVQKVYSLLQGADLLNDPLVSFVVQTKNRKKYWKGIYNKTVTRNGFGNSDVAIAMESLGNFTIKGVRLDAAAVVAASFKTLSQGIQLMSAVYGVAPVKAQGESETGANTSTTNNSIADIEAKKKELEIRGRLSKLSTIAILEAIISRKDDLQNSATLPGAITAIKSTFDIYKPQLSTNSN